MEKIFISQDDCYLFGQGTHYDIYKKLGAHPSEEDGVSGMHFAVWAEAVHVAGTFNGWSTVDHPMTRIGEIGIWERFIPGIGEGELYKYVIDTPQGSQIYKADPYANQAEMRPGTASVTADLSGFAWGDKKWMSERDAKNYYASPMSVYECHIGSWMKHPDGTEDGFYNYRSSRTVSQTT